MQKTLLFLTAFCFYAKTLFSDEKQLDPLFTLPDLAHSVSVVTGDWIETGSDFETQGPDPICVKRIFYETSRNQDTLCPEWQWNIPNLTESKEPIPVMGRLKLHYDSKKNLNAIENPFGLTLSIDRSKTNSLVLTTSEGRKITYSFEPDGKINRLKKVKRPGLPEVSYSYKPHPKERRVILSRREEPNGRFLQLNYDNQGRVREILTPAGPYSSPVVKSKFEYAEGRTTWVSSEGYRKIYYYNKDKEITRIDHLQDSLIRYETFQWNQGKIKAQNLFEKDGTLLLGKEFTYDQNQRVIEEKLIGSLTGRGSQEVFSRSYKYNKEGRIESFQETEGPKIEFIWNGDSLIEKKEGSRSTKYLYDKEGLLTVETTTDGLTNLTTHYVYSARGLPTKIEYYRNEFLLKKIEQEHTPEGWLKRVAEYDPKGICTRSLYYDRDEAGRVLSQTDLEGKIELFSYDANGNLIRHLSAENEQTFTYDYLNQLIGDNAGNRFAYDFKGNTTLKTDECGNETHFSYDSMGRLTKVVEPAMNTLQGALKPTTYYEYDSLDRISKKTDPSGQITKFKYNARGSPVETLHFDGTVDRCEYTLSGKIKRSLLRNLHTQEYEYDERGQVILYTEKDKEGLILSQKQYSYSLDKIIQEKDLFKTTTYDYNRDGTLSLITQEAGGIVVSCPISPPSDEEEPILPSPFKEEKNKVLNSLEQMVWEKTIVNDDGLVTKMTYDPFGRVVEIKKIDPFGQLLRNKKFVYDLKGIKVKETLVEGMKEEVLLFQYNASSQLEAMYEGYGSPHERKTSYTYYPSGEIETITKPDSTRLHMAYDTSGKLKSLISSDRTLNYHYSYDEKGRLSFVEDKILDKTTSRRYNEFDQITSETLLNGLVLSKNYDEKGQKISLTLPDHSSIGYSYGDKGLSQVARYSSKGEPLYQHTYHDNEEGLILNLGLQTFHKDTEGRFVEISSPYRNEKGFYEADKLVRIEVDGKTVKTLAYDSLNRLVCENETAYSYDAFENRIKKGEEELTFNTLNEIQNPGYRYDRNGNLIESPESSFYYDALNRLVKSYSKGVETTYTYDPFNRRMSKNDLLYFYDGMHEIGSVKNGIIDDLKVLGSGRMGEVGAIVAVEMRGEPFAAIKDLKGSIALLVNHERTLSEFPWGFIGKRQDAETGLIYFGSRYLDPELGRFTTCDPKGYVDGMNLYHHAKNNPYAYTDLFGHWSIWDSVKKAVSYGLDFCKSIYSQVNAYRDWINHFTGLNEVYDKIRDTAAILLGKGFLAASGAYAQEMDTGVIGNGEIDSKVRISFAHGILNLRSDLVDNLRQISNTHGGTNIHYVFRPTQGFTWDILKCMAVKFGFVSQEASEIIKVWRQLIEEMGGVTGGGKVIHYAHSVGGTDTFMALTFLTPDEQKMIDVRTFGSATLIPEEGNYSAINYVSVRDGVCFLDPGRYLNAVLSSEANVLFIGNFFGVPLADHALAQDSYQEVLRSLGQAFLAAYGN